MSTKTTIKVLALASYPVEAAATRYRIAQFIEPLRKRGIDLTLRPLLDANTFASLYNRAAIPHTIISVLTGTLRRIEDILKAQRFDAVLVQREALLFGPPLAEWLITRIGRRPLILDLDDATYVPYVSQSYGRLARSFKWFGKTDELIRWSRVVTCGNRFIAEHVEKQGTRAVVIPTVVDPNLFRPASVTSKDGVPVIGWIGTHSTFAYLETILPVLEALARERQFRLKIIGSGQERIELSTLEVETLPWKLSREIADFQSFDIGLYPLDMSPASPPDWLAGKSGFKAIQYMTVGIPFVVTPVGVCAEIGEVGVTHLTASSKEEWNRALSFLISESAARRAMGVAGREHALKHYSLTKQADLLGSVLLDAIT